MTNGAQNKRGKLHHSPSHSDIRPSNPLNRLQPVLNTILEQTASCQPVLKHISSHAEVKNSPNAKEFLDSDN
jgi:hypothetical protein